MSKRPKFDPRPFLRMWLAPFLVVCAGCPGSADSRWNDGFVPGADALTGDALGPKADGGGVDGSRPVAEQHRTMIVLYGRHVAATYDSITADQLAAGIPHVHRMFHTYSYGKLGVSSLGGGEPEIHGWFDVRTPLAQQLTDCPYTEVKAEMLAAARAQGIPVDAYQHVVFAVHWGDCIMSAGLAVGEGDIFVKLSKDLYFGSETLARTIVHELAHEMGLPHANGYRCMSGDQQVTLSDNCTSEEYQDPVDVMGAGWNINALFKEQLGWIGPQNVKTVTQSGSYTLVPLEEKSGQLQLIRIERGGAKHMGIEYRIPEPAIVPNLGGPAPAGVYIRFRDTTYVWDDDTNLIDPNPDDKPYFEAHMDAVFLPGMAFYDPTTRARITMGPQDANGATVNVAFE